MTAHQCDTILQLVSIAENSTPAWWTKYNYIEDIGDGRGFTINIVGFTTSTGDFLWLVENLQKFAPNHPLVTFLPALRQVKGSPSLVGLENLPKVIATLENDPNYLRATWNAIIHFYWGPTMATADSLGLNFPLSRGQLYDIIINMGDLSLLQQIKTPAPNKGGKESAWLNELQDLWLHHITKVDLSLNKGQADRALMWKSIFAKGNMVLVRPIKDLACYGDSFSIN